MVALDTPLVIASAIRALVPNSAGALWIGLLIAFLVFGDSRRILSPRNIALAGLLLVAPLLVDILRWGPSIAQSRAGAMVFAGVFASTAGYAAWGVVLGTRRPAADWTPNLSAPALRALVVGLVALNGLVTFGRAPDDAGYYSNIGARRWVETGRLPYADSALQGADSPGRGAAATYGPVLYAAHIPFQFLAGARSNPASIGPMDSAYRRPPVAATQLTAFAFHLLGLAALYVVVAGLSGPHLAWGALALYAGSPYVLGIGGSNVTITGLAFVSHIAPSAVMLLGLALWKRPAAAGAVLALAAGILFYPLFALPAWLGWWLWRKEGVGKFVGGFLGAGLLLAALVIVFTPAAPGSTSIGMMLESTLGHQEGAGAGQYGLSPFGFWGTHPALAGFWQAPLIGHTLATPAFIGFALLSAATFFLAKGRNLAQLAGLTVAVTAGVQLWKTHGGGTYVEWYYPFLLVALLGSAASARDARASEPQGAQRHSGDLENS